MVVLVHMTCPSVIAILQTIQNICWISQIVTDSVELPFYIKHIYPSSNVSLATASAHLLVML